MNFYNIIWLFISVSGGVSMGIMGLLDLHYFPLLLVNPTLLDKLIIHLQQWYFNQQGYLLIPVKMKREISS